MSDPVKLNIGSGLYPCPGWLNVDLQPAEAHIAAGGWPTDHPWQIDIVGDCRDLPFDDGEVDRIFFGHILEHLAYNTEAVEALNEAYRVLKDRGEIGVVGPAMDYAIEQGCGAQLLEDIGLDRGERWAESDKTPGFAHLWEATSENTLALVKGVFPNARIVDVPYVGTRHQWPTTNAGAAEWQVGIYAYKEAS